jgi:hypothetical protein
LLGIALAVPAAEEGDMNRLTLIGTLGISMLAGGFVEAQTAPPNPDDHAAHHPAKGTPNAKAATKAPAPAPAKAPKCEPGMNCEMMGQGKGPAMAGKMGHGQVMEGGHMMGKCSGMFGQGAKVEVNKLPKGAALTITSDDPKVIERIQNMAEGMKGMHEAKAAK